jgi:hypothetical protein
MIENEVSFVFLEARSGKEVQTGLISNDALNDESSLASLPSYLVSYLLSVDSRTARRSSTMK